MSDIFMQSGAIALELEVGYLTEQEICHKYDITEGELQFLRQSPLFQREVAAMKDLVANTSDGESLRAKLGMEVGLNEIKNVIIDTQTPPSAKVKAVELLYKIKTGQIADKQPPITVNFVPLERE